MRTKEEIAAYQKQYRLNNLERLNAAKKKYAEEHPEYQRDWHSKHPGKRSDYRRDWVEKNALLTAACRKASWANEKYPGKISGHQVLEILEKFGVCHWCGIELAIGERTLEHLEPINDAQYLTVACAPCNSKKLHRTEATQPLPSKTVAYNKRHAEQCRGASR